jgi:hypothetical protein
MGPKNSLVQSVGYYSEGKCLVSIGKKIMNREKYVKEEGVYSLPETLVRYQQRPLTIRKLYRDMFRLSLNFENKFLSLPSIELID